MGYKKARFSTASLGIKMKIIAVLLLIVIIWYAQMEIRARLNGFDDIEWQGETFKLKKKYLDYEQYKKSNNPLAKEETERVKEIMLKRGFSTKYSNYRELVDDFMGFNFPGYGYSSNGTLRDENNSWFVEKCYEIPNTSEARCIIYKAENNNKDQPFIKKADYVVDYSKLKGKYKTKIENESLIYYENDNILKTVVFKKDENS